MQKFIFSIFVWFLRKIVMKHLFPTEFNPVKHKRNIEWDK